MAQSLRAGMRVPYTVFVLSPIGMRVGQSCFDDAVHPKEPVQSVAVLKTPIQRNPSAPPSKVNNKYLTNKQIPSISFDEAIINHDQSVDENEETSSFSANISSSNNTNPSVNVYSKFLTANNLMTDRGGVVNIRTGSFNLGCQQDQLSDELTDSYEFFNSMQNSSDQPSYFTRSCSNYSFKNR